jgi:hypothetical protein
LLFEGSSSFSGKEAEAGSWISLLLDGRDIVLRNWHRPPLPFSGPLAIFSPVFIFVTAEVLITVAFGMSSTWAQGGLWWLLGIHIWASRHESEAPESTVLLGEDGNELLSSVF